MSNRVLFRAFFVTLLLSSFVLAAFWSAGSEASLSLNSEVRVEQILGDGKLSAQVKKDFKDDYSNIEKVVIQQRARTSTKDALIVPLTRVAGHNNVSYFGQIKGTISQAFNDYLKVIDDKSSGLDEDVVKKIKSFDKKVNIRVLATTRCPHCRTMSSSVSKVGYLNKKINIEIINISDYQDLAMYYNVRGVPMTVINEKYVLPGAVNPGMLMEYLKQID